MANLTRTSPVPALMKVEEARVLLAECRRIDEAMSIKDKAQALAAYMRRQKAGRAAALDAEEIALRAERRVGELLRESKDKGERRPTGVKSGSKVLHAATPSLSDLGVTRPQSSRWQDVARVPEEKFEGYIREQREKQGAITTADLRREHVGEVKRQERTFKLAEIARGTVPLPKGQTAIRYPVIYADPPWRYEHVETDSRAIENQYPTMSLDEIRAMKIADLCTPDALLFMWATSPKLAEAMTVVEAWGFTYRTSMVWVKDKLGMGYYARQRHELLLIATRGSPPTPAPAQRPDSVIEAPRGAHSEKPAIFAELIERMYPALPKIELFCRSPREGWAAWGNQAA